MKELRGETMNMIPSGHMQRGEETRRIKNREAFLYFLDLEVKRARRYQEFLSIIVLRLLQSAQVPEDKFIPMEECDKTLKDVLAKEVRETDILGTLEKDKIAILLPYADAESSGLAQSRIKHFLKPYDFKGKGCEVEFRRLCFPVDGINTMDLIDKC